MFLKENVAIFGKIGHFKFGQNNNWCKSAFCLLVIFMVRFFFRYGVFIMINTNFRPHFVHRN